MTSADNYVPLRKRMRGGTAIECHWFAFGSAAIVEAAVAASRPAAVVIDMQHGLWSREALEGAVTAARPAPVLVRTASSSAVDISSALDSGAEGVLVPLIETADEAAAVVARARFPPDGVRSGGGVRPLTSGFEQYVAAAAERTMVGVMIETAPGLANVDAIARVPGVDLVLIGTGDLSLSLRCFPGKGEPYVQACSNILAACRSAGISCGMFTGDAASSAKAVTDGYVMVVVASDINVVMTGFAAEGRAFSDGLR